MQKTKLYVLKHPDTEEIRYVGITIRTLQQRLSGHICDVKSRPDLNYHKINWIRKILELGIRPKIELVFEYESLEEAKQAEIEYIAKYKELYKLTNATKGGDHVGNRTHTRESILKRKTTRAVDQYNIFGEFVQSYEITEDAVRELGISSASKITMCCKGNRPHSHGYVWRYKGEPLGDISAINKDSLCFNRVVQYTLEGDYVADFDSYLKASAEVGDRSKGGNISSACKGKQRQCKGFIWKLEPIFRYTDEQLVFGTVKIVDDNRGKKGKKINQLSMTGKFIKTFATVSEASKAMIGTINGRKAITGCCNGTREEYKNFKWQYCPEGE